MSSGTPPPLIPSAVPSDQAGELDDIARIKRQSVRGGAITFVAQGANVAIQLTSTVVLARLLSPADYGVMAMVMAITGFAGLFRDLGLSSSTIQKDTLSHEQLSTIYWINVGLGTLLTVVVATASPLVGLFYGRPELNLVTAVVSLNFLIGSFGTQAGALLTRNMQFGRLSVANLSGALLGLIVSTIMAVNGLSYWSLVAGSIAGTLLGSLLLNWLCGWRPGGAVRGAGVRSMLRYGANITAFDVVNYFQRNLDNILIGRFWGAGSLGLYSRAYALLMFPIQNVRGPINAVAFPAMSRLQHAPQQFRDYYLATTRLVALLSMPLTAFLFVTSEPVIIVALGPEWVNASPIFSFLALAAFVQPPSGLAGSLLLSRGDSRRYFQCGLFNMLVLSTTFVVGLPWGPVGVAIAYAVGNYVVLYPWLWWAFRGSPVSFRDFAAACSWPAAISVGAAVAAMLVQAMLTIGNSWLEIACAAAVFAAVTLPFLLFTRVGRAQLEFAGGLLKRRGTKAPRAAPRTVEPDE